MSNFWGSLQFASAFFALACIAFLLLASQVTLNCDDYMYGLFTRKGLRYFLEQTKWHYTSFNGRALVHFVLTIQLWIGYRWYTIFCPLMLGYIYYSAMELLLSDRSLQEQLVFAGLGMMATAALPVLLLRESVMWLSGAYNYVFPMVLLMGTLKQAHKREHLGFGQAILTFLTGATTEQYGVIVCVFLGLYWLLDSLQYKRCNWYRLLLPVLAACGTLTIVLAPGMAVRTGREVSSGILSMLHPSVIFLRMKQYLVFFAGRGGCPVGIILFMILSGTCSLRSHQGRTALAVTIPAGVAYTVLLLCGLNEAAAITAVVYLLFSGIVMLFTRESQETGVWGLAVVASQFMVLLSNTVGYRMALPGDILLFCACLSQLAVLSQKANSTKCCVASCMAFFALLIAFVPTLQGFHKNAVIERKNENVMLNQTEDYGVIDCSGDPDFRFLTYHDSAVYLSYAKEYYSTPEGKHISYSADEHTTLAGMYGDHRFGAPALTEDGVLYFPAIFTTPLLGESNCYRDYLHNGFVLSFRDDNYMITDDGSVYEYIPQTEKVGNKVGETVLLKPSYLGYMMVYMPADSFKALFNIQYVYNEAENTYYVSVS